MTLVLLVLGAASALLAAPRTMRGPRRCAASHIPRKTLRLVPPRFFRAWLVGTVAAQCNCWFGYVHSERFCSAGLYGDWEPTEGAYTWFPAASLEAPRGVVHFVGGAFVGAASQLTYRYLLEQIAAEGFVVVATRPARSVKRSRARERDLRRRAAD